MNPWFPVVATLLFLSTIGAKASDDAVLVSCVRSWFGQCASLPSLQYLSFDDCVRAGDALKSQMGADNVRAACLPVDPRWNRALFPKD
jgi:hypothetical protein